jgi:drug/metabolite transporter (DMT)-like permease
MALLHPEAFLTLTLALMFLASIAFDVAGQLFFKIGADALPDLSHASGRDGARSTLANPWIAAGLVTYLAELILWLMIMAQAPISVAFPIASANFLGIALASWWFLGERVTQHQWMGAGLITFGVALVASSA